MKKINYVFILITAAIFIGFSMQAYAQELQSVKAQAQQQMKAGLYGEAIELLNRYISANPRRADGYNLRGLCYEARDQLEQAVYDFRLARKVSNGDPEILENLNRATEKWHAQLRKKIQGHLREIAIDPSIPENYLQIGKSYKRLGQWSTAEEWYDKYIAMEDPSPDEVIRYTEIVAKTGNHYKGERILERYVKMYPKDHRLWSRYGYFTMWAGKRQIAIDAFETALELRPYFKEAQDGLDQALGKGYVYTYHDTVALRNRDKVPPEYAIDKFYRQLRANPGNDEVRFLLVEELYNVGRLEEAYQQIMMLGERNAGEEEYEEWYNKIMAYREEEYNKQIEKYVAELEQDPYNKEALKEIADYYSYLQQYDEALYLFEDYYAEYPDDEDLEMRYKYAQLSAWVKDYYNAVDQMDYVLERAPDVSEYQLFRGLLAVWTDQDLELAQELLESVYAKEPENEMALIGLASLESKQNNFEQAEAYVELIKEINSGNPEIATLESNIETQKLRAEEERIFNSLEQGRAAIRAGDCYTALEIYDEFLSRYEPNRIIRKEYADINGCVGNYDLAIQIYTELLDEEYDYLIDLERAKLYYAKGDFLMSEQELTRMIDEDNDDFYVHLFLGDTYMKLEEHGKAEDVYEDLLETTSDSTEIALVEQRLEWIPASGFSRFFETFPSYLNISPFISYFSDNLNFEYLNYGMSAELGLLQYFSIGGTVARGFLANAGLASNYNMYKANIFGRYDIFTGGISFGQHKWVDIGVTTSLLEGFLRAEVEDIYRIQASYYHQDAGFTLYSPNLVFYTRPTDGKRLKTDLYRLEGYYTIPSGFRFGANFSSIEVSDGNNGIIFTLRLGKFFLPGLLAGYEFSTTRFARTSVLYFSPQDYESHSLFAEWKFLDREEIELTIGGRVGLIPNNDYILKEIFGLALYKPFENLTITARAQAGNTVRQVVGYASSSFSLAAYWAL